MLKFVKRWKSRLHAWRLARRYALVALILPAFIILASRSLVSEEPGTSTPQPCLYCYISTGDNHWLGQSLPIDSKASIEASFDLLDRLGVKRVYWRGLEAATWVEGHTERPESCRYFEFWKWLRHLYREVDPDRLAVQAARERGMEIWGVANLVDWGSQADTPPFKTFPFNSESRLRIEHPEWVPVDRYGILKQGGPIELAYPEARRALVDLHMKFMTRDGYDGMVFLTYAENHSMRFQDEFGFNEPIVKEFKKRHGIDIRYQDWTRSASRFDWYGLRGEYVTQFLRELKAELDKTDQKLGFFLQPWRPHKPQPWNVPELMLTAGNIHFDLETWVRDGLVDNFIVYGNSHPQAQVRAIHNMRWLTRQTAVDVEILTSGPSVARWKPFQSEGVPTVVAWGDDAMYLDRSFVPEQPMSSLQSDDPLLVMRALTQIVYGKSKAEVQAVAPLVRHPHLILRRLSLQALGKIGDPAAVPILENALFNPENSIRCMAALALRDNHRPESVDRMLEAMEKHGTHPLAEIVQVTLSRIRPVPREKLVGAYRNSDSVKVRRIAMRALQYMPDASLIPVWKDALDDEDRFTRWVAARGLAGLRENDDAVQLLLEAVEHQNPVAANQASVALGQMVERQDSAAVESRSAIREALTKRYSRFGDGYDGVDVDWGYRPVGIALLTLGKEGEDVLQSFINQPQNTRLAEMAWKSLYIRQRPDSFSEVTEKENAAAFRRRPVSLKKLTFERLSQNFDDGGIWSPKTRGAVGDVHTIPGRWGALAANGPLVDDAIAHSGPQSLRLQRGGDSFTGQAVPGVADGEDYQVVLSVYLDSAESSFLIYVKGHAGSYQEEAGVWVAPGGALRMRDVQAGRWIGTDLRIAPKRWTTLRLISNRNVGVYTATVQAGEDNERRSSKHAPLEQQPNLRLIQLIPQPPEGNTVHVDNVKLMEVR